MSVLSRPALRPALLWVPLVLGACEDVPASSYYGTWVVDGQNENELLMFAFFEDGTYIHAEYDAEEAGGERSGMEWGTISADTEGVLAIQPATFDENGDTGLNDFVGTSDLTLAVLGDSLTLEVVGGDDTGESLAFTRVQPTGNSGTFFTTETENELLAFSFLPGDVYCHFEYDEQPGDEVNGMECSEYSLGDDGTMILTEAGVWVDNNGDTGLTDFIGTSDLQLVFDDEGMTANIVGGDDAPDSMAFGRL